MFKFLDKILFEGFFYNMYILVCVNMKFKYFIYLYIKDLF